MSPSPFVALSMGTPYLKPIKAWDPEDPWNRERWATQHDHIAMMDLPYTVHAQDYEGFVAAIKGAIETPPKPYNGVYFTPSATKFITMNNAGQQVMLQYVAAP
ncbi:hypothetical protein EHS25_007847 [Saitozyma podzolica]|uniref:Uncharacterized protein n=1 Tax=Saitozyma podzolica TaxID=1890683 RepID=A0A427YQX6_9TREE|nr:hypothetical protein EHS25_007847 [Saitozyma podzolica]